MDTDRTSPPSTPQADTARSTSGSAPRAADSGARGASPAPGTPQPATVLVRGETVGGPASGPGGKPAPASDPKEAEKKPLSAAKVQLQGHLPALEDDADVGVQKEQVVVRDGKADLTFTGTLLASAAPDVAPHGEWDELRVYETSAGKYVFSKITRHTALDEEDEHEAEIFEPEPSSKSSQLLRNARDLTRAHPLTWKDEAVDFFGYEPLAKTLYRKLGDDFEEHVS